MPLPHRSTATPLAALLPILCVLAACSSGGSGGEAERPVPNDGSPSDATDGGVGGTSSGGEEGGAGSGSGDVAGGTPTGATGGGGTGAPDGGGQGESAGGAEGGDGGNVGGGDGSSLSEVTECSPIDQNRWADGRMRDFYLYGDRVPPLDPDGFEDADALVKALRVEPDTFSYVGEQATYERRIEEGYLFGYGYWTVRDAEGLLRFRRVWAGSPTEAAGIERGDVLMAVNGVPVESITDEQWAAFRGERDVPTTQRFTVRRGGGEPREVDVTSAEYYFYTADFATWYERDGVRVGYLSVSAFYETTEFELDEQIEWLAGQSIDELVVDFRYNPGGRASVARRFAAQLVGDAFADEPFQIRRFNERYAERDSTSVLDSVARALDLPRFVALVSGESASAAESVINGLQPYVDVTVIGTRTVGKPFSSFPEDYCGKTLHAMNAIRTNAAGVSVAGGIEPDCLVTDEFLYRQDDERDALTAAGLAYLFDGACPTDAPAAKLAAERAGSSAAEFPGFEAERPADVVD